MPETLDELCHGLRGKCSTSEYGSYVKRPTDGAAQAWAAPHTVCAGYAPPPMDPERRIAPRIDVGGIR